MSLKLSWVLLQKFCVHWMPHQLISEIKSVGLETCQPLLACFLASKARVVIFCIALSQVIRVGCVSVTDKPVALNIITPLLPETKKILDTTFCWKMRVRLYLGYRGIFTRSTWSKYESHKGLKHSIVRVCEGRKTMLLQHNAQTPHECCHFRDITEHRILSCSMHFLAAWIWQLLTSDRLHVPRNIWKECISHVMKKFRLLWEQPEVVSNKRESGKMGNSNSTHSELYLVLCFI